LSKSFLKTRIIEREADQGRIKQWRQHIKESNENDTVTIEPKEKLHRGKTLPWILGRTMNIIQAK